MRAQNTLTSLGTLLASGGVEAHKISEYNEDASHLQRVTQQLRCSP